MLSLTFGLIAALCWGVHDVCASFATARAGIPMTMLTILITGLFLVGPAALILGDWSAVTLPSLSLAALSGATYSLAAFGLYRAFGIGPVRLVSPVIGAFPILSLLVAAAQGRYPTLGQWLAVFAIVFGVAMIAVLTDHHEDTGGSAPARPANATRDALIWASLSALGFGTTFALGQFASQGGNEWPTIVTARTSALMVVGGFILLRRIPLQRQGVPWGLLCAMGFCDATALGLVQAAGTLPHAEFAAVTSSIFGVVTILLAWAFLKEKLGPLQWGSVAVVFAGIGYLAL